MADVFISYASEDKAVADEVAKALNDLGLTVWWDEHIPAGAPWPAGLNKEIQAATCVVFLISEAFHRKSHEQGWLLTEAVRAIGQRSAFPIRLGDIGLPFGFDATQALTANIYDTKSGTTVASAIQHAARQVYLRVRQTEQWFCRRQDSFLEPYRAEMDGQPKQSPLDYSSEVQGLLNHLEPGSLILALCADKGMEDSPRDHYFRSFYEWAARLAEHERSQVVSPGTPNKRIRLCRLFLDWDQGTQQWIDSVIADHRTDENQQNGVVARKIDYDKKEQVDGEDSVPAGCLSRQLGFVVFLTPGKEARVVLHYGGKRHFRYRWLKTSINVNICISIFEQLEQYAGEDGKPGSNEWVQFLLNMRAMRRSIVWPW